MMQVTDPPNLLPAGIHWRFKMLITLPPPIYIHVHLQAFEMQHVFCNKIYNYAKSGNYLLDMLLHACD